MPKHGRSWMSGCKGRAEVLASLSPTQHLPPNHDGVSTARRKWHADGEVERGPYGEVEG